GRHTSLLKLKKLSLPISLGVKQAVTYKRQSLFIMSTLLLTAFIFSGTINAYNTLLHLGENLPYWGLDNSEVTVEFPIGVDSQYSKSFVGDMKKDDRVESILPWCWSRASYRTTDGNSKILETMAYDGDMDALGITNLRGRNPRTKDEVSLAVNTCKDMKKDVGDFVDIYLQGVKKTLLVTGVYQSTMDGGTGFRFQMKTMEGLAGSYDTILYSIKLKEGNDPAAFINSLQSSYGRDIDARRTYEIYKGFLTSTIDNLSYALIFLFLVFTVVSFIIVFNITLITIYQQKKDLGIFKALGMTNPQIRNVIACKTLTAGLTGILIGIPFGILVTPRLMNLASSGMGIVNLPFTISLPGTFGVILLSIFIALIGVWIASRKVTQIKLNNLINE
ncbi:MAG: ABC transporter permease, partial [Bacillota bacterium]|nr:ABC transporter permease [Bacillota bacterium]